MTSNHSQANQPLLPFEHNWRIYYEHYQKQELQELINISDVGQFWGAVNTIWSLETFCNEPVGTLFHMMRGDIKPRWEDETLATGGNLNIILPENIVRKHRKETNELWLALLMNCVGEQFDTDRIVGLSISRRPHKLLIRIWDALSFPSDTDTTCDDRAKSLICYLCADKKLDQSHVRIMNKALSIYYKDHAHCKE